MAQYLGYFQEMMKDEYDEISEKISIEEYEKIVEEAEGPLYQWANLLKEILNILLEFFKTTFPFLSKNWKSISSLLFLAMIVYGVVYIVDSIAKIFKITIKYAKFFRAITNYIIILFTVIFQCLSCFSCGI